MIDKQFGHYDVTGKIGEGGMGQVYSAMDSRLQRRVALKVLPEAMVADREHLQRFEREAQVLASLNHPNIATLLGLEEVDGRVALVMELIEGEDLSELIRRGPVPPLEAARIGSAIASAVESAHDKGIIHRDLKPGNVKLGRDGVVKVLDFGLAKAMDGARGGGDQNLTNSPTISLVATQAGIILGTAAYMSPEQAAGQPIDRRCDIWSFGVMFYEMLSGGRPFEGETLSHTLADVLRGTVDWDRLPADTPAPLLNLLKRCLDRNPQKRLRDIGEARVALDNWIANPVAAEVVAGAPAETGWKAKLPWGLFAATAAGLLAALVLLWPRPAAPTKPIRFNVDLGGSALFASVGSGTVLSRDGSMLAFVVGNSGGNETALQLRSLDDLDNRQLIAGENDSQPYNPFFSPNGEWIGFVTPVALMKVRTTGGSAMTLAELRRSRGAAWGPSDVIVLAPGPDRGLSKVVATGGQLEPLTTLDEAAGEISHRWPSFLPDGENVLFSVVGTEANWDNASLHVVNLESGERHEVFRGGTYGQVLPSGHLIYVSRGTLFAVPFDLKALETFGSASPIVEEVGTTGDGGAHYSVSDTGTLVHLTGSSVLPEYPILRVTPNGARETLWNEVGTYAAPRVSPDGTRLSVTRETNGNWDIWVFDLERGSETRLTFSEADDTEQIWSPDGEFIVWSSNAEGPDTLYRKRSDGSGQPERLVDATDRQLWATSWSSDGRYLAMVDFGTGGANIVTLDLEGDGILETFLDSEFNESSPAFSPDGRWIAYNSPESGQQEVYVRPFPVGGGKWQISAGGGATPHWSPDGRQIIYRGETKFMSAAVDGTGNSFRAERPRGLLDADFLGGLGGIGLGSFSFVAFDVAPDGSFIVFPSDAGREGIDHATFVLNWTEELSRTLPSK